MYAGGIVGVEKRTNICSALCVHFHSQCVVIRLLFEIQSMPTDSILWLLLCAWCSARFIAAIFLVHTMLFLILTNPLRFSTILLLFISKSYIVQTGLFIILTLIPSRSVNRTMGKPPFIYLNEIVCFSAYPFTFVRSFTHSLTLSPIRFISFSCTFITVLVTDSLIYFLIQCGRLSVFHFMVTLVKLTLFRLMRTLSTMKSGRDREWMKVMENAQLEVYILAWRISRFSISFENSVFRHSSFVIPFHYGCGCLFVLLLLWRILHSHSFWFFSSFCSYLFHSRFLSLSFHSF